jgi:Sulphur transport
MVPVIEDGGLRIEDGFFDLRSSIFYPRLFFTERQHFRRMTSPLPTFGSFLYGQYDKAFGRPWPVIPSALVIAALNVFLFAFDRPWTASDGMRNWGDGLLQLFGAIHQPDLLPPLLYSGSVLNLGLLTGAMAAALLSREFDIRAAPINELIIGGLGGLLMGWGAMLSFGCNIGGFFSAPVGAVGERCQHDGGIACGRLHRYAVSHSEEHRIDSLWADVFADRL